MKAPVISILLCLPLTLFSQSEDECPCMDPNNHYEDFIQTLDINTYEASIEDDAPSVQTYISYEWQQEKKEEVFVFGDDESEDEDQGGLSVEDLEQSIDNEPIERSNIRSKIRKKRKRYKVRVKSRKSFRRYSGKCPFF